MKTDAQLQLDVIARLKLEPAVNEAIIGVAVVDGIVILTGHVNSYTEKFCAEQAALRVAGIKAVTVEMSVTAPGSFERTDADIARSAASVLQWTTSLPLGTIKVMVEHGWVTLSGEVFGDYQRQAAAKAVSELGGVKGVSAHQITVQSKVSLNAVKSDIEAAMKHRATADARSITVDVRGADVTLTGTVHSRSERDVARHSARTTPGVRNVVDKLTVVG
jgi:osmotically-inducible protein OsmY